MFDTWTLGIQSEVLTTQIRYRLFDTLEFLRYKLWEEILSELSDAEQFWQSFGAFKIVVESYCSSILQWFIAWYGYCPMKDQFQMHSMYEGTLLQAELLSLFCSRDKLCVVEIVVVHFVQLYFANA